jgi:hypothetical protein
MTTIEDLRNRLQTRANVLASLPHLAKDAQKDIQAAGKLMTKNPELATQVVELTQDILSQQQVLAQAGLGLVLETKTDEKKTRRKTATKKSTERKVSTKAASARENLKAFAKDRNDLVEQLALMTSDTKPNLAFEDLTHLLRKPKDPKFDPSKEDDQRTSVAYLRRTAGRAHVTVKRGQGLSLDQATKILHQVHVQSLGSGRKDYQLIDAPPQKKD